MIFEQFIADLHIIFHLMFELYFLLKFIKIQAKLRFIQIIQTLHKAPPSRHKSH